jgi:hypothetical protein
LSINKIYQRRLDGLADGREVPSPKGLDCTPKLRHAEIRHDTYLPELARRGEADRLNLLQ